MNSMTPSQWLDIAVLAVAFIAAISGWRSGALGSLLINAFGKQKINITTIPTTADIGSDIFQKFVIPFEVISLILLAALVGAVVIARRD